MEIEFRDVGVTLSDDDFECIVDIAGYGIHYWCPKAIVGDDTYEVFYYVDADGEIADYDNGDGVTLTSKVLTKQDVADGIARIISDPEMQNWSVARSLSTGDVGEVDSTVADQLIQMCLWGKGIFG